jgi:hypothetical protein
MNPMLLCNKPGSTKREIPIAWNSGTHHAEKHLQHIEQNMGYREASMCLVPTRSAEQPNKKPGTKKKENELSSEWKVAIVYYLATTGSLCIVARPTFKTTALVQHILASYLLLLWLLFVFWVQLS